MRFKDKVAIVTGAGSGIGQAAALLFAAEGAKVVSVDIVPQRTTQVVQKIERLGGAATGVVADVSKVEDVDQLVGTAVKAYGRVDILVNNAGVMHIGGVLDTKEEDWDRLLDNNFRSVYRCTRRAAQEMVKTGGGKIVNTASMGAFFASPQWVAYAAVKGAVVSLTRAMGLDLIRHKIHVNAICPGATRTNIRGLADARPPHNPEAAIPVGYRAEPEDQARVILFLASRESDHMVGQCLWVDGGCSVNMYPLEAPWLWQP